jgi:DNA helicase HerA-like ATPase
VSFFSPRSTHDDIVLGVPITPRRDRLLRLKAADQALHATIWGRTGSGKSRFLQSMFLQHLTKGHGVCLIDPHHDLSFDTLSYLVEQGYFKNDTAFDRLIYLDWGNGSYVPFNVLSAPGSPQTVALNTLEAMFRVWPELRRAPTFQTLVLGSMIVLIKNHLPLTSLHEFLSDAEFREQCLARVDDPLIRQTFARFGKVSGQAQEAGSALRRAFLMAFHDISRLSMGQPDCILNFREVMDEGRSVIINLGNIGDAETRRLIGALLLVQIEQAALSRTDIPTHLRRPWTVLLDEWPSFAATDKAIATILEQTRKFGLRLYLAAQSTSQVSSDSLEGALENCRLNVAFGLGRNSAVDQSRQLAGGDVRQKTNLIERILAPSPEPQVPYREQIDTLMQDLQVLPPQEAYVKLHTAPPVRIKALEVHNPRPAATELASVLATYRSRYQRSRTQAEARMAIPMRANPTVDRPSLPFELFGGAQGRG